MISPRRGRIGGSLTEVFQSPSKPTDVKAAGDVPEFYAVVLPKTATLLEQDKPPFIFTDLPSTIQFCKRFKESARWKKFSSQKAALEFCGNFDVLTPTANGSVSSKEERKASGERSPFRSPRSQDYVRFRKCIVDGDKNLLLNLVWSNPRYIIGGGDNPTILHEGCRYNAFHIAARCNKPQMLEVLLSLLRNENLFRMLYPDDDEDTMRQRIKYIINMYLNIPDKTKRGDRPLHFASAMGFVQCVEVLINQEECIRDAPNGEGFTPVELAGTRVTQAWPLNVEKAIIDLFNEHQVIIPVIRDELCSEPPSLGAPMNLISKDFDFRNPPKPYSRPDLGGGDKAQFHIVAYIGPVTREHAAQFVSDVQKKRASTVDVRRRDAEKGLEHVVRSIAKDQEIRWNEFWPFLDEWADLTTRNGLLKFEEYFIKTFLNSRQDSNAENLNANNKRITKEHATADSIKALKNVVDGVGVDHPSVQSLETDLVDADHNKVAGAVTSYVLAFMSEHERKYVKAELTSLEEYPLNHMKSCVVRIILSTLDKEGETVECKCDEHKNSRAENNRETGTGRRKSKPSILDTLQICFIHGPLPSRTDYQVWMAIESMAETIEQHYFPAVYRWISNMAEFPTEQMAYWGTPKKSQAAFGSPSSPSTSVAGSNSPSTPLRASKKGAVRKCSRRPRRAEIIPTDLW